MGGAQSFAGRREGREIFRFVDKKKSSGGLRNKPPELIKNLLHVYSYRGGVDGGPGGSGDGDGVLTRRPGRSPASTACSSGAALTVTTTRQQHQAAEQCGSKQKAHHLLT